ncbi:UTP-glucose-1-phosphate uridylyltransferase [Aureococcus anophagefferens]|nr:UTP-glucose-1-phosphate uridylyltransferase [Aureococcus anophagefferens]
MPKTTRGTSTCATTLSGGATTASATDLIGPGNAALLSASELALLDGLAALGQTHLLEDWPAGDGDADKRRLLLAASARGDNPFEGFAPSVPDGETLVFGGAGFGAAERDGLEAARKTGFVLVAGGLGERLGYDGIKLELPVELATGKSFLELYVDYVLAVQARARADSGDASLVVPLCIMTSDDTDAPTRALLEAEGDFGAEPGQIEIMKQDKVAALSDGNAKLAVDDDDRWALLTKPHGHGDVHSLMRSTGIAKKWRESYGLDYVFFFQDTNPPGAPHDPPGAGRLREARLLHEQRLRAAARRRGRRRDHALAKAGDDDLVINVEYNQLDPMLRAATGDGDVNDPATGFSPYPGNANVLVLGLADYVATLHGEDLGVVDEFVNPKYKDDAKCDFKKPTRLECMMQDYPKLLRREVPGAKGEPAGAAGSAEFEVYAAHATRLGLATAGEVAATRTLSGVAGLFGGPKVVLLPSFALTQADVDAKVKADSLDLDADAVLVLDGANIAVESAKVSGGLKVVNKRADASVVIRDLVVSNGGLAHVEIPDADIPAAKPFERIRGYKAVDAGVLVVEVAEPGHFLLSKDGQLTKLADEAEL